MNLGNFYDYIPIRAFASHDDVANFVKGFNLSPWWVYGIGGYIVAFLIWHFFTRTMILAFISLNAGQTLKIFLMIMSVAILFGYYGMPGLFGYGEISYFLSITSLIAIPGMIFILWPTRDWVIRQLNF